MEKDFNKTPVIIEIGPNVIPFYLLFNHEDASKIRRGKGCYIAVDCSEKALETVIKSGKEGIVSPLSHLPLRDNSADQIWLRNVFGEWSTVAIKEVAGGEKDDYDVALFEVARVIKPGGKIYIEETTIPADPRIRDHLFKLTERDYSNLGLKKEVYLGREQVDGFMEKNFGRTTLTGSGYDAPKPFFMVLRKSA